MLFSKYDMERPYDETLKRVLPYLIFPQNEFKIILAEQLVSFCHFYRDKENIGFSQKYKEINEMLDKASFEENVERNIHSFKHEHSTILQSIDDLNKRLTKLENGHKQKQRKSNISKETIIPVTRETNVEMKDEKVLDKMAVAEMPLQTAVEAMSLPMGSVVQENKARVKPSSKMSQVAACIKNASEPLTAADISKITGVPGNYVHHLEKSSFKNNVKIEKRMVIRDTTSHRKKSQVPREMTYYSWVEDKDGSMPSIGSSQIKEGN